MYPNFFELIRTTLQRLPEVPLLVWPNGPAGRTAYTGAAILSRVQALREALASAGVRPTEPVLLALPVSQDLVGALLAIQALGAVPVLPPAALKPRPLLKLLRRHGIRTAVVARAGWRLRLLARLLRLRLVAADAVGEAQEAPAAAVAVGPEQAALVSHSSGSTGQPKAIRRGHAVLRAQHEAIKEVFPPWAGQRDFPLFPNLMLHNLAAGVTSILPDLAKAGDAPDPARLVAQLRRERVQTLTGNVHYFNMLLGYLRQHPVGLPDVVGVGVGGSPVPEELAQELRACFPAAAVHVIYGSSEAEPIAVRRVDTVLPDPRAGYCVGSFHPTLEWQLRPLGVLTCGPTAGHAVGEVLVRGAHVASARPDEWLATGDYGYVAGGQLFLTGRQGNERLHQGVQHYQIEHALSQVPGVQRVAARAGATDFTVYVQGPATPAAVAAALAQSFPPGLCGAVRFRPSLPVDARHQSKILYDQL
ncbi:MAG TPA: AMP-binding protein [Hymenobacter sp.]|jgi:acyl-CoA synthetase (AMP-forming)/AMP-acid ligase II|uniref:AMP-binding protein n=1 Tax=Hymenobacter sp. TaxID=1898978 RepID=UPI002EDADA89